MALDPSYLRYDRRRYGMDHERYAWSMLVDRPAVTWPNGARIALWLSVHLEFFPLNPEGKPFKLPGGMVTPYPDLRHFTLRDYGNRVGVQRLLRLFERLGLRASFATNAAVARRTPSLLRDLAAHELVGHGRDMDHPHYGGMAESVERSLIADSLATLREASGQKVEGWISPGKSESERTPELLVEHGVRWFGDWINDDMPYRFETAGGPLVALPHSAELSDRQILIDYRHAESDFTDQLLDQHRFLAREAAAAGSGRVLAITLHPWVIGQPHRISALERALEAILREPGIWNATGTELCQAWQAQQGQS
jgi:peptidoglycan/xylan/chitin deacetylase (PgdA/CDA1 family)